MKKIMTITTMIIATAFIATSVFAWCGAGGGMGTGTVYNDNPKDRQAFYDQTADLRASLSANLAERAAIMSDDNPSPERVRALTETIAKQQDDLRKQAGKYNVTLMGAGMGMGMGNNGYCTNDGFHQNHRGQTGKHMMNR